MKDFKFDENEFVGAIKNEMKRFIEKTDKISDEQKDELLKELGVNWFDERFNGKQFFEDVIRYSVYVWSQHNFNLSELWKQIAIANASVSEIPYETANKTIEEFKKEFNVTNKNY